MIEKKTRKTQLKAILLVILTTIIVVIISISNNTFAKIASDSDSPVDYLTTKQISYPSIFDLLPAEQRDGDYIYIKYEDIIAWGVQGTYIDRNQYR